MVSHKPFLQDWLVVTAGSNCGQRQTAGVLAYVHSPNLTSNAPTAASAPWTNSKGSDTMMLLEFLEWLITLHLRDPADYLKPHEPMLDLLKTVVKNSLEMCKAAYKHPLWVRRECAQLQYCNAMVVVRGYKRLAQYFLELGVAGFRLKTQTTCSPPHSVFYEDCPSKTFPESDELGGLRLWDERRPYRSHCSDV